MKVIAPAKVNLCLHIKGKRGDGYHLLESLIAFTDFGDDITIVRQEEKQKHDLVITGEFAKNIPEANNNIALKSVIAFCHAFNIDDYFSIHIQKNIPVGAGLGGGSSDAASILRILCAQYNIDHDHPDLFALMISLGADVPVCFYQQPCFVTGIGDVIESIQPIKWSVPIILVHPRKILSTPDVFQYKALVANHTILSIPRNKKDWQMAINQSENDLEPSAAALMPDIIQILEVLNQQSGLMVSRMTGSGSCFFGLFDTENDAMSAVKAIKKSYPDWWVTQSYLAL